MNIRKTVGIIVILFALLSYVSAQAQPTAATATQQAQNLQQNMELQQPLVSLRPGTNAPELYQGENADVGEQHILRLIPQRTYWQASVSSEYLYTDNALLTQHPYISSSEFVNNVLFAFAPTPYRVGPGRIAPQAGYTSEWFDYGLGGHDLSSVDFNIQSAFAGAKYFFSDDLIAFGQLNYNWFFQQNNYSMFYRELVPEVGIERLIQIGDDSVLELSADGDWHDSWQSFPLGNPTGLPNDLQNRADATLSIDYAFQIMRKLVVQPFYRFQYTYYPTDSSGGPVRHDFLNSYGISGAWFFTPNFSLRVFMNGDAEQVESDKIAPEYHDWNVGANLSYACRF